ncbi:dynamin family protein [Pasteurella atlantica]|uniref:Dynamin family protein n=2 Tax=Pasteurellaceae TaxID=712 RepID=A0ACC6HJE7_9PAST|nr:dynamin family protein [Pasteurella atlantica]MDP8050997.1 dynamin family protein [Pasteurella atlantica]MDP8104293.1 dynamin family protein [Pasteurella atlantica]MDP8147653.1 dynamin family protein [Pasteurella atlantica]
MTIKLQTQKQFLEYVSKVQETIEDLEFQAQDTGNTDCKKELENLTTEIKEKQLVIPIVGGFSAGKSTLLNSFLGVDKLPVAITPETSVAAELIASEREHIVSVDDNGTEKDNQSFDDIKRDARNLDHIKVFLNNQNLREIEPLILVDMPGFDSPVSQHNKAIDCYMNKAAHFVFLNSVEDGTVPKSILQQMDRVTTYFNKSFSFGITKTDLRPQTYVEEVKEEMAEQLEDYSFDKEIMTFELGSGENLKQFIQSIKPEHLFKEQFVEQLLIHNKGLQNAIQQKIETYQQEDENVIQAIKNIEEDIKEHQQNSKKEIKYLRSQVDNSDITSICNKVMADFYNKIDYLSSLYQIPDLLKNEITQTVSDSLTCHLKERLEKISKSMAENVQYSIQNSLGDLDLLFNFESIEENTDFEFDNSTIKVGVDVITLVLNVIPLGVTLSKIIKIATPIIHTLSSLFFSQKVEQQLDYQQLTKNTLLGEVAPQIKSKIDGEISKIYREETAKFIEQNSKKLEEEMQKIIDNFTRSLLEKEQNRNNLEQEISKLNTIITQLNTLKTQYLN